MLAPSDALLSHGSVRYVDRGEGPAVVLIHGIGGNWQNWLGVIEGLAAHHRVVALDLPGFGRSEPFVRNMAVPQYAQTLIELLDAIDIAFATLVGNSMGGAITIEAAAEYPDRVIAAVLACSAGVPLTGWRHTAAAIPMSLALNLALRNARRRRAVINRPRLRRSIAAQIVHDPRAADQRLLAEALHGLGSTSFGAVMRAGAGHDARPQAGRIACPTLVLWGARDRLLPLAMGRELHRCIDGSELVIWDDSGHCPMIEHPKRFEALVSEFVATNLDRHSTGAPVVAAGVAPRQRERCQHH